MRVEEYAKSITVAGFRLNEAIVPREFVSKAKAAVQPSLIQLFNADSIAGSVHILYAAVNALKTFKQGRNIAQSLDVEVLLYVSTQRQIRKALEITGLQNDSTKVAAAIIADDDHRLAEALGKLEAFMPGLRDDSVLDISEDKRRRLMELYDISQLELETVGSGVVDALSWLIIEKCALLDIAR